VFQDKVIFKQGRFRLL